MSDLNFSNLISRAIILLTAFSVHEFAHAWVADQFGDTTPRYNGRLTLNPLAHLDPMGSLMLIVAGFGWAKPVPINPYTLKRRAPSAVMWVSLAGPTSNLLLAILAAIPFRLELLSLQQGYFDYANSASRLLPSLSQFLLEFILINLSLMLFNLIPVAPLDGEKIAEYLFPPAWADFLVRIRPYGPAILMILFIAGPYLGIDILGWILGPALQFLFSALVG